MLSSFSHSSSPLHLSSSLSLLSTLSLPQTQSFADSAFQLPLAKTSRLNLSSLAAFLLLASHVWFFLNLLFLYISYQVSLPIHLQPLPSLISTSRLTPSYHRPPHSIQSLLTNTVTFPPGSSGQQSLFSSSHPPTIQSHHLRVNKQDGGKEKWRSEWKQCIQCDLACKMVCHDYISVFLLCIHGEMEAIA